MSEISQLLQQRFGLSEDQAQEAERAVIDLLKSKVPQQYQGILDPLLGSNPGANQAAAPAESGGMSGILTAAEGLLSKA